MKTEGGKQKVLIIFMCSFLVGIIYTNLVAGKYFTATNVFNQSLFEAYGDRNILSLEYIIYILKNRIIILGLLIMFSTTKYRKIYSVFFIMWTGFSGGILAVTSVLNMGSRGIIVFLVSLFPQYLFYYMSFAMLIWYSMKYPEIQWNTWKTSFVVITFIAGVVAEIKINPYIVNIVLSVLL